jgi:uncharacterized protein YndB with AHSA1/START domain
MPKPLEIATPSDREVRITRDFDAPRELVWDCHTKPELVRRWISGPPGWSMRVCEIDLRVGGRYRYVLSGPSGGGYRHVLSGPNGEEMGWGGVFREIRRPEFISATEQFDEDWTGGETLVSTRFEERDRRTTVTVTIVYSSNEARDGAIATGMTDGMEAGYQLLDQLIAEQVAT